MDGVWAVRSWPEGVRVAGAGNELGEAGGVAIAEALKTNSTLHTLYLDGARRPSALRVARARGRLWRRSPLAALRAV